MTAEPQFCERQTYIWQKNGQKGSYNSLLSVSFISNQRSEYIINLTWRRIKSYLIEILLKSSNLVLKLQLRYDKCLVKLRWLAVLDPFFLFLDRKTLISAEWQQQCGKGQYKKKICKDITDKCWFTLWEKFYQKH